MHNEEFQYSGYLFGWLYTTNQLYRTDYTAYQEIYSTLDDRMVDLIMAYYR